MSNSSRIEQDANMQPWGKYLKDSEKQTAERTVDALLAAGWQISVDDGEEITVKRSTDKPAILAALGTTEEDFLRVHQGNAAAGIGAPLCVRGWVRFVWGNEDWVAICDHTTNLEEILKPVFDWMEAQEKTRRR